MGLNLNPHSEFNELKFSRALHYIAFNYLAYSAPHEDVLDSKFEAARKYIRNPNRMEFWPYYFMVGNSNVAEIRAKIYMAPKGTFMLPIFDFFYFVNLFNDKMLADFLKKSFPENIWEGICRPKL